MITIRSYYPYIPSILVAAGILIVTLWEFDPLNPPTNLPNDKLMHALAYAMLAMTYMAAALYKGYTHCRHYIYTAIGCIAYGALMEALQAWITTTRTADIWDILANAIGVGCGLLVLSMINYLWLRKHTYTK